MFKLQWSLLFLVLVAVLFLNVIVMVAIQRIKGTKGKIWRIAWPGLMTIAVLGALWGILTLGVWAMYDTPVKSFFNGLDRIINNVLNQIPQALVIVYFCAPLLISYIIYVIMAVIVDHKKKKEQEAALASKMASDRDNGHPLKWSIKLPKLNLKRSKGQPGANSEEMQLGIAEANASLPDVQTPMELRQFINKHKSGGQLISAKHGDWVWTVLTNSDNYEEAKRLYRLKQAPDQYPAIVRRVGGRTSLLTVAQAVNQFRRSLNSKEGAK